MKFITATMLMATSLLTISAIAEDFDMKWNGGAGLRYSERILEDGVVDNDAAGKDRSKEKNTKYNAKVKLGVTGKSEELDWAIGLRTQSAANSEYAAFNPNGLDIAIAIDVANFLYRKDLEFTSAAVTVGRQKTVFAYDSTAQTLFANDLKLDGLGWQFSNGAFGLNVSQYLLGASTGTGAASSSASALTTTSITTTDSTKASSANPMMNYMFGFQPTYKFKFQDEIEALVAVGYYNYITDGYSNTAHGIVGTSGTLVSSSATQGYSVDMDNAQIWQFLTKVDLPYELAFSFEYLRNKKVLFPSSLTTNVDRGAFELGLYWRKNKKAGDFSVGYNYMNKGLASNYSFITWGLIPSGLKGHHLIATYNVTDKFTIFGRGMMMKEKNPLESNGTAMGTTTGTSAFASYETKVSYFEIVAATWF